MPRQRGSGKTAVSVCRLCVWTVWFDQRTSSPTTMFTRRGSKTLPWIETWRSAARGAPARRARPGRRGRVRASPDPHPVEALHPEHHVGLDVPWETTSRGNCLDGAGSRRGQCRRVTISAVPVGAGATCSRWCASLPARTSHWTTLPGFAWNFGVALPERAAAVDRHEAEVRGAGEDDVLAVGALLVAPRIGTGSHPAVD